jgi:regulator of replication initiation timing
VDLPEDGSNSTFDGRDGKVDESNGFSAGNTLQRAPPGASTNTAMGAHLEGLIAQCTAAIGDDMESAFQTVFDKLDNLTRKVDRMALEEVALRKAYHQSTAETAALKATVDTLTKQLDENTVFPAPPLPDPTTSPSAMEEMTTQLSHVQHDIQDVLEAVRNPPGKRKRRTSNQDTAPATPTNR